MLGRTHMATGLLISMATLPLMEKINVPTVSMQAGLGHSQPIEDAVLWIGLGVVGSLIPDLDEFHSIATRKVEGLARIVLILFFIWLGWQHGGFNVLTIAIILVGVTTLFGGDMARKSAMLMMAIALLLAGILYDISLGGTFAFGMTLLAMWSAATSFGHHRTFTHSSLGLLLFGAGGQLAFGALHVGWLLIPVLLGYTVHLAADMVSGGVPLWWPIHWSKHERVGIRIVKTGSFADMGVGAASVVMAMMLAVSYLHM